MSDNVKILTRLSLPVCMYPSCQFAVNADYLASHLKYVYGVAQKMAIATVVEVRRAIGSIEQTATEKKNAIKYLNYGSRGTDIFEALSPLPLLCVAEGRRC
jgi:hypothetical protein